MAINILEAKNRLSELIRAAMAGEDVVIANRGQPVVRLVPVAGVAVTQANPGSAGALLGWLDAEPRPDPARRTAADIDRTVHAARQAWD